MSLPNHLSGGFDHIVSVYTFLKKDIDPFNVVDASLTPIFRV